jgi:hypothetical protein
MVLLFLPSAVALRADLVTGDPKGKKSSCYLKLNCKGIPPHGSPRDS